MLNTLRAVKSNQLHKIAHQKIKVDDIEGAWQDIAEILNINMDDPRGLYMAGVFFRRKGHSGMAAQCFRRCVALVPDQLNPWVHFGACLHDMHHYDEAMEVWDICKKKDPNDPMLYRNYASTYQQMGDYNNALNNANKVFEMVQNPPPSCYSIRAMAYLGLGRWKEGFKEYKYLYGDTLKIRVYCQPEEPEWNGEKGKTVVIQGDQGIGDEIRYASMLDEASKDANLIYDCHPKMATIFKRSFPNIPIYGTRKQGVVEWLKDYKIDAHCHISGLGRFYRHRDKDFPRKTYLVPNEELRLKWREKLKELPKPHVGIAWQGGNVTTGREFRSTMPVDWVSVIEQGGTFVDLSYHDSTWEREEYNKNHEDKILKFDIDESDYDDTLALLAELDLVISVPTTVMHARGAVGLSSWVLVPQWPQWEFGRTRRDMIWYPENCVKLFRCESADLMSGIAKISKAYGEYLRASGLHRNRPKTAARVHSITELDHKKGEQASPDNPIGIITVTDYKKRPDGVHF
jgi:tetratricopeptide (TPR) repeat protein